MADHDRRRSVPRLPRPTGARSYRRAADVRRFALPLGPLALALEGSGPTIGKLLRGPAPGWTMPILGRATVPEERVTFRTRPEPTGAVEIRTSGQRTFSATGPLWSLRWDPRQRRTDVWLAPPPPPFRTEGAVRSALQYVAAGVLLWERGLGLHGAAVVRDGRCVLALGASGAGKTTFATHFPWDRVLADDFVAVRWRTRGPVAFGTPFRGRECAAGELRTAPVAGVAILAKGGRTALTPLDRGAALAELLPRVRLVGDARVLRERALSAALRIVAAVPVFRLDVSLEEDPWPVLIQALDRG